MGYGRLTTLCSELVYVKVQYWTLLWQPPAALYQITVCGYLSLWADVQPTFDQTCGSPAYQSFTVCIESLCVFTLYKQNTHAFISNYLTVLSWTYFLFYSVKELERLLTAYSEHHDPVITILGHHLKGAECTHASDKRCQAQAIKT